MSFDLRRWIRRHLWWTLAVAAILGVLLWEGVFAAFNNARILTDVIRLDLDDIAGDLVALAAVVSAAAAWRKAKRNGFVEQKDHDEALHEVEKLNERVTLLENGRSDEDRVS